MGHFTTALIVVTITDINDEVPVCTKGIYTFTLNENEAGSWNLPCDDPEGDTLSYTINLPITPFTTTAAGVEVAANQLDFETTQQYTLDVIVSDTTVPIQSINVVVIIEASKLRHQINLSDAIITCGCFLLIYKVIDVFLSVHQELLFRPIMSFNYTSIVTCQYAWLNNCIARSL